jgi:threonine dehydrogenase-like Zn-dependent dehydrogenase
MAVLVMIGIVTSIFATEPQKSASSSVRTVHANERPVARVIEAAVGAFSEFLARDAAIVILLFVVLFKFTDAFSGAMTAPFVIDLGFSRNDYAAIVKGVGLAATLLGGFAGGQAEYARVPFADVDTIKIPDGIADEKVLFLSDIFPTGYMAAENCSIQQGDTVAVWGCGPVGQFAIASARLLGAERIIGIDRFPERLRMAREKAGADDMINYEETDVYDTLMEMTGGIGPDACIDAVGMEAHAPGIQGAYDRIKQSVMLEADRPYAFRQAIMACRKGGTISVPGVCGGFDDKIPMGALMNKALTLKTGQTHVQRYMQPLLERIERGEIDPSFVITHRMSLEDAAKGYDIFLNKQEDCVKVVLKP